MLAKHINSLIAFAHYTDLRSGIFYELHAWFTFTRQKHISSGPLIEKTSSSLLQALCKQSDMVVDHKHVMVVSSSSTTIKIALLSLDVSIETSRTYLKISPDTYRR